MKCFKKILMFICVALLVLACKKESVEEKNTDRLQGRWQLENTISVTYTNDKETDRDTSKYKANQLVFEFKADSAVIYNNGKMGEQFLYSVSNNQLILREGSGGEFFDLKWGSNKMGLVQDNTSTSSSGVKRRRVNEMNFIKL